jgi:Glyoxalase-like domain
MPVRLHHIVIDAHDLPGLARFWTQALGWKVLSARDVDPHPMPGPAGTVQATKVKVIRPEKPVSTVPVKVKVERPEPRFPAR